MTEPNVELIDLTPALAEELLTKNTHNRPARERVWKAYAADMESGNWNFNGDAIRISQEGVLLDGQHRCLAVVSSGATIQVLLITGLPPETQDTVDGGAKRKLSDVLALRGHRNATNLASVLRLITQWETNGRLDNGSVTNSQALGTLERIPWIEDGIPLTQRVRSHTALPASIAGFTWWLFASLDAEEAEAFFERLITGENLRKGNPIYTLRSSLASMQREVRGERSTKYLAAITIKAWNAWRRGDELFQLKFRLGGSNPEVFPEAL